MTRAERRRLQREANRPEGLPVLEEGYRPPTRLTSYGLRDRRIDQLARETYITPEQIAQRRERNRVARASRKANR